jgi:hypothetical protein
MRTKFSSENTKERDHFRDSCVDGKIIIIIIIIIIYLREMAWEVMDWIHLIQDRDQWKALVNTVMNLWAPQKSGNFLTSSVTISFSSRSLLRCVS